MLRGEASAASVASACVAPAGLAAGGVGAGVGAAGVAPAGVGAAGATTTGGATAVGGAAASVIGAGGAAGLGFLTYVPSLCCSQVNSSFSHDGPKLMVVATDSASEGAVGCAAVALGSATGGTGTIASVTGG